MSGDRAGPIAPGSPTGERRREFDGERRREFDGERAREPDLRTWISSEPLDPGGLLKRLGDRRDGGLALFVGRVREWNRGRRVERLVYEAYREMAEEELARIAAEVAARSDVGAISAVHRVGELAPGEPSVAVAVAAPHRAAAFEASRAVIEEIKTRLPVWKREVYADGTVRWLGAPDLPGPAPAGEEAPPSSTGERSRAAGTSARRT